MRGRRIVIRTRLVLAVILAVTLYLSLRWVAFTFQAEIEGLTVRIEYQQLEKGPGGSEGLQIVATPTVK